MEYVWRSAEMSLVQLAAPREQLHSVITTLGTTRVSFGEHEDAYAGGATSNSSASTTSSTGLRGPTTVFLARRPSTWRASEIGVAQLVALTDHVAFHDLPFTRHIRRCEDLLTKVDWLGGIIEEHHAQLLLSVSVNDTPMRRTGRTPTGGRRSGQAHDGGAVYDNEGFGGIATNGSSFHHTLDHHANIVENVLQLDDMEDEIESLETEVRHVRDRLDELKREARYCYYYKEVLGYYTKIVRGQGPADLGVSHRPERDGGSDDFMFGGERGQKKVLGVISTALVQRLQLLVYRGTKGHSIFLSEEISSIGGGESYGKLGVDHQGTMSTFCVWLYNNHAYKKIHNICGSVGAELFQVSLSAVTSAGQEQQLSDLNDRSVSIHHAILQSEAYLVRDLLASAQRQHALWKMELTNELMIATVMNKVSVSGSSFNLLAWMPTHCLPVVKEVLGDCAFTVFPGNSKTATTRGGVPPTLFRTNKITAVFQSIVDGYGTPRYREINPTVMTIVTFPYLFGVMFGDVGHGLLLVLFALCVIVYEQRLLRMQGLGDIFGMLFRGRYVLMFMGLWSIYIGLLYNDWFGLQLGLFQSGYTWLDDPNNRSRVARVTHTPNGDPSVKPMNPVSFGIDVAWAETDNKLGFYNSVKMKCAVIIGIVQMFAGLGLSLMNKLYERDMSAIVFRVIPETVFLLCTFGYMAVLIMLKWATPFGNTNDAPSILETMTNFFLEPGSVPHPPLYRGQAEFQMFLLGASALMVPVMLICYPVVQYMEAKKRTTQINVVDLVMHSVIHTIEYVLGSISNTASYLRLWALSLAHAQLSEVFLDFTMVSAIDGGSAVGIAIGFAVWLGATVGVLVGMEGLSAFLHSLRLHWVEFQGKFYAGDGRPFQPLQLQLPDGEEGDSHGRRGV